MIDHIIFNADFHQCMFKGKYTVFLYKQGGAINCGLKSTFSMYWPSCLIEAHVSPEKFPLVCVGLLAVHLFNEGATFQQGGLLAAAE
jgi:hypothetical protein